MSSSSSESERRLGEIAVAKSWALPGVGPAGWDDFNKEAAAQIIGALRLPVAVVLDYLQEDES